MAAKSAKAWKQFYAEERATMGELALRALLERTAAASLSVGAPAIFPHTMLSITGAQVAAVARAIADQGCDEVLAIGVLHRGRDADAEQRGVHVADAFTSEEFSLDALMHFLSLGPHHVKLHVRYPFLMGESPSDAPGVDETLRLAERMPIVATTDPVHYGVGYGDEGELFDPASAPALAHAEARIRAQLAALEEANFGAFASACAKARSDFRDAGPLLALACPHARYQIEELALVDYASTLQAASPTWVAGARISG